MKVYTIQTVVFYEELLRHGVAFCDQESWMCHEYRLQYDWMTEQMRKRIGEPPVPDIKYPVWVWLQCESKKRPAPPMSPSEIQDGEELAVMLELNVPDDAVLLSDFMLWHQPLNNGAVCTKRESKDYEKSSPENQQERMIGTWERIFDLDMRDPYITMTKRQNRAIQGTIWLLRKEWLKVAHIFNRHSEIKRIIYK